MPEHFNTNHIPFSEETWLWIKDKITPVIYNGRACFKTIYGDYITPDEYDEYYQNFIDGKPLIIKVPKQMTIFDFVS